jgi:thioredoxin 2
MSNDVTYSICEKCGVLNRVAFFSPSGKRPVCGKCKDSLPLHDGINDLQAPSLDSLLNKSPLPIIADFWAPWCGPCRGFVPTFIETASRLKNRVVFGKVDTEANPMAAQKFGIRGIPTIIVFHRGKEVRRMSGALPFKDFIAWVEQTIQALS